MNGSTILLFTTVLALGLFGLSACDSELHHDLAETEANEIVALLDAQGISASKERDPGQQGRWMVSVSGADSGLAWRVLEADGLPKRTSRTFEDLYPRSGLLPSRSEEQVLLQTATAGKLEESLRSLDGVVDARVHLVLPRPSTLGGRPVAAAPPKASVLVRVSDKAAPTIDEDLVAGLVAFGSPDLEAERVDVAILASHAESAPNGQIPWERLGPLQVASSSKGPLQLAFGFLLLGIMVLSVIIGAQRVKIRRLRGGVEPDGNG